MELRIFDKFVTSDPHDASVKPVLTVSFTFFSLEIKKKKTQHNMIKSLRIANTKKIKVHFSVFYLKKKR